jgi:membrane-associated phospholipid phosphatase
MEDERMTAQREGASTPFMGDESTRSFSHHCARMLSTAFQPTLASTYLLLCVSLASAGSPPKGLIWFLALSAISTGIPFVYLWLGVRRGALSDLQVVVREQRLGPLLVGLACTAAAFALALYASAPAELVVTILIGLTCGAVLTLITLWWKISFHTAALAGATVVLVWVFGPFGWVGAALTLAVGWSRVSLHRHTIAQAIAGAGVAAVLAPVVLLLALRAGI